MAEFLLEILSEEIPARMQAAAARDLQRLVAERLAKAGLSYGRAEAFVTPRRLALVVDGLPERQPEAIEERKGPRVGAPAPAIAGFLRAAGLARIEDAEIRDTGKGRFYFAVRRVAGKATAEVLAAIIREGIVQFSWPKSMRWGTSRASWVRPLHGLLAILDGDALPVALDLGGGMTIAAGARTDGHRFLAPGPIEVASFADYAAKLRRAYVILDPAERRRLIEDGAAALAAAEGLAVREDPALLDEVAGLVEWPVPMLGRIDPQFLDVPAEVLITAMRAHQKYFALTDGAGRLAPRFVLVANTPADDGGQAIVAGNERVLRARLSDARYFWDQDRRRPLEGRVEKLQERVFHARLGSDYERTERLTALARRLAPLTGADPEIAARAARLAKADLTTQMVGEFPELQGIMGRYYALAGGEEAAVADAIRDHYAPQGPADRCPTAPAAVAVALADKIDTLAGFFSIGEKPTGSKDPFALRRAALGVIRLVIENGLRLPLRPAFIAALAGHGERAGAAAAPAAGDVADELLAFFAERLKVHLREKGVRHDLIAAVLAGGATGGGEDDIVRLLARVDALRDFLDSSDGANLLTAFRRASNIVRIEETKDRASYDGEANPGLLAEPQELELHQALGGARGRITGALEGERFRDAMAVLAGLRPPVDAFFDHVQVNCADKEIRVNRLKLLSQIRSALGGVADFSLIEG